MAELIEGKRYRIVNLDPMDAYSGDTEAVGVALYVERLDECYRFLYPNGATKTFLSGLEVEEIEDPPREAEFATMEFDEKDLEQMSLDFGKINNKIEVDPWHDTTYNRIQIVSDSLKDLLQFKNKRYGDTALTPINVFSKTDAQTGLLQRIDDKISRIKNSESLRKNDVCDLMGYLTLLCISKDWHSFDEFKD